MIYLLILLIVMFGLYVWSMIENDNLKMKYNIVKEEKEEIKILLEKAKKEKARVWEEKKKYEKLFIYLQNDLDDLEIEKRIADARIKAYFNGTEKTINDVVNQNKKMIEKNNELIQYLSLSDEERIEL